MSSFCDLTHPTLLAEVISNVIIILSNIYLQIDIGQREDITVLQCHIHIRLHLTLIEFRSIRGVLVNNTPTCIGMELKLRMYA